MTDTANVQSAADQKLKEAYFTASQGQLIWQRFKKNKSALIGAWTLIILILAGFFAPLLTPYDATISGRDKDYLKVPLKSRNFAMTTAAPYGRSYIRLSAPDRSRRTSGG